MSWLGGLLWGNEESDLIMTGQDRVKHLGPTSYVIPLCPRGWNHWAGMSSLLLQLLAVCGAILYLLYGYDVLYQPYKIVFTVSIFVDGKRQAEGYMTCWNWYIMESRSEPGYSPAFI